MPKTLFSHGLFDQSRKFVSDEFVAVCLEHPSNQTSFQMCSNGKQTQLLAQFAWRIIMEISLILLRDEMLLQKQDWNLQELRVETKVLKLLTKDWNSVLHRRGGAARLGQGGMDWFKISLIHRQPQVFKVKEVVVTSLHWLGAIKFYTTSVSPLHVFLEAALLIERLIPREDIRRQIALIRCIP